MISVKNLFKKYTNDKNEDKVVINSLSAEFKMGEKVVIIGPSGSGKSTFLRCLNLLEIPDSGEIWLDGKRISNLSVELYPKLSGLKGLELKRAISAYDKQDRIDINRARAKMGMVFQHFNLFNNLNVLELIAKEGSKSGLKKLVKLITKKLVTNGKESEAVSLIKQLHY